MIKSTRLVIIVIVFLMLILVVFIYKFYLRPKGLRNDLMDCIPNLFTALSLPLLYYLLRKKSKKINYLNYFSWSSLLLCFYEFSQLFDSNATFDWYDIMASILGSTISTYLLYRLNEPIQTKMKWSKME